MKSLNGLLIGIIATAVFFTSCSKEGHQNEPTCQVTKVYFYDSGVKDDSATYSYMGNKVTKVQTSSTEYITYEYKGDKVVRRNFIFSGNPAVPDYHDSIAYNNDGTPARIVNFVYYNNTNFNYARVEFTYSGGKLTKATIFNNDGTGQFEKEEEDTYTYTGNNITALTSVDYSSGVPQSQTINYTYDNNSNYFTKQNAQFFFVDPYISTNDFDATLLPLYFSANNVTGIGAGALKIPVTYILDQKNNLQQVKLNGSPLVEYVYFCN